MAEEKTDPSGGQEQAADQVVDTTKPAEGQEAVPAEGEQAPAEGASDAPAEGGDAASPADGEAPAEGADQAAPAEKDAETPKEETKPKPKALIKKIIPIAIGVAVVILVFIGGFFIGSKLTKPKVVPSNEASGSAQEASNSATLATILTPDCIGGFQPYTNPKFSICIPNSMKSEQQEATESGQTNDHYVFENDVETLTVKTNYGAETPAGQNCVSSKPVKVAGYQAFRWTVKSTDAKGNCSSTVVSYLTTVSNGNDQPVFAITMSKKNGVFQSDNGEFAAIEGSFLINGQ
jgi:hypothetical protein